MKYSEHTVGGSGRRSLKISGYICYNYTSITVESLDNITHQLYNYVYGYDAFDWSAGTQVNEPPPLPPIKRSRIGIECGRFSILNSTYTDSTTQRVLVDWICVRQYVLPQPIVIIKGRESINYGWVNTTDIDAANTTQPHDCLLLDFNNATDNGTFKIVNLSAGTYSITITMGDNNQSHDYMYVDISINGSTPYTVISNLSTDAGEFETNWFTVTLQNRGNISLTFRDEGDDPGDPGNAPGWVVNGIDIERGIKGIRMEVE